MSEWFTSILLGIIQGLTEFLPVSSDGHLVLAQSVLPGFAAPPLAFDVLLHGGTLAAAVVYFRRDLASMAMGLSRPREGGWRLPLLLVAGTVPVAVAGLLFKDLVESLFSSPVAAACGLLTTAAILIVPSFFRKGVRAMASLTFGQAVIIGSWQVLALFPGVSRSGSTIAAALVLGLAGTEAARFSFLLSIPAVAGALILQSGSLADGGLALPHVLGAASALVAGLFAIAGMMRLLKRTRLAAFAVYCLALGSVSLVIFLGGK